MKMSELKLSEIKYGIQKEDGRTTKRVIIDLSEIARESIESNAFAGGFYQALMNLPERKATKKPNPNTTSYYEGRELGQKVRDGEEEMPGWAKYTRK